MFEGLRERKRHSPFLTHCIIRFDVEISPSALSLRGSELVIRDKGRYDDVKAQILSPERTPQRQMVIYVYFPISGFG